MLVKWFPSTTNAYPTISQEGKIYERIIRTHRITEERGELVPHVEACKLQIRLMAKSAAFIYVPSWTAVMISAGVTTPLRLIYCKRTMFINNPLANDSITYSVRSKSVQSRAGSANVTWLDIHERVILVIHQLGAGVVNGRWERLRSGEATILARYISDLVLRQARERTISRVVREVGERQCALGERGEYREALELHLEGWFEEESVMMTTAATDTSYIPQEDLCLRSGRTAEAVDP